jgi:diaminopimelate epimerase
VQLTKHHGLANDFLVILDEVNGRVPGVDGELARRLCDRRRGIGADGLIHGALPVEGSEVDVVMHLFNADGGRAEISGNGIRCLGQALAEARELREAIFVVSTDAGRRRLQVEASADQRTSLVSVDMGPFVAGPAIPADVAERLEGRRSMTGDMGNPHLVVLVDDVVTVDVADEGAWFEQHFADGVNVEFIAAGGDDALALRVWERGAGITEACGTGACAAAHVAHAWGLVGDRVRVEMPGGSAEVQLGATITLIGPAVKIATIELADV